MKKSDREKYLGRSMFTSAELSDLTVSKGTLPKHLENAAEGPLCDPGPSWPTLPGSLNANLHCQLSLFGANESVLRHSFRGKPTEKQRYCD